jgi:hypothetical protein
MASSPLDVECIHTACLAQKGEPCGEFDIETGERTPFVIAGAPGFHGERYASLAMDQMEPVDKSIIDRAAEDYI